MSDRDALQHQAEALERQADALEAVATELRYQNAVLAEMVSTLEEVARQAGDRPVEEPPDRSQFALQSWIRDHLHYRDDAEGIVPEFERGAADNWEWGVGDE